MVDRSYLIQNSALTEQAKSARIIALANSIRQQFSSTFNVPIGQVIVRQAEPDIDLGFTDTQQITGALVADAETDFVVRDLTNVQTVIAFFALNMLSAGPSVNRVRFKTGVSPGTGVKASLYTEPLFAATEPKGWLEQAVTYAQERMLIRVEAFQTVAAPGDRLVLEGLVAEKSGNIVTELNP